jgi:hypothetical protein
MGKTGCPRLKYSPSRRKPAAFSQENQLPTLAEWGASLDSTPNVARPVAIAFFTNSAVKDFASFLISAEREAERKAIADEIEDEERIRADAEAAS